MGLATLFGKLVDGDPRFEVVGPVTMGLVCFRLKVSDRWFAAFARNVTKPNPNRTPPRANLKRTAVLCFAQGDDAWTKKLYERLMNNGQIYMVTATVRSQLVIRFVVCSHLTEATDVQFSWSEIRAQADKVTVAATMTVVPEIRSATIPEQQHVVKSLTQG